VVDFVTTKALNSRNLQRPPEDRAQQLQSKADNIVRVLSTSITRCPCLRTRGSGVRISPGAPPRDSYLFERVPASLFHCHLAGYGRSGQATMKALQTKPLRTATTKKQLLISPAPAPQPLPQLYRVSDSNPRVARCSLRSPWFHFR
jgi:hypothetical protein